MNKPIPVTQHTTNFYDDAEENARNTHQYVKDYGTDGERERSEFLTLVMEGYSVTDPMWFFHAGRLAELAHRVVPQLGDR